MKPSFMSSPNSELTKNPFTVLAQEIGPWQDYNFPGWRERPHWLMLGISEEMGELAEALDEDYGSYSPAAVRDAIGDLVVFTAAYCEAQGFSILQFALDLEPPTLPRTVHAPEKHVLKVAKLIGKLCHARLKTEQGIRGTTAEHLAQTMVTVEALLTQLRLMLRDLFRVTSSLEEIVAETWGIVRRRDWQEHRKSGQGV